MSTHSVSSFGVRKRNLSISMSSVKMSVFAMFALKIHICIQLFRAEIFTFGATPWDDVEKDIDVLRNVRRSVFLAHPPGCPSNVYSIMKSCWQFEPASRPIAPLVEQSLNSAMTRLKLSQNTPAAAYQAAIPDPTRNPQVTGYAQPNAIDQMRSQSISIAAQRRNTLRQLDDDEEESHL